MNYDLHIYIFTYLHILLAGNNGSGKPERNKVQGFNMKEAVLRNYFGHNDLYLLLLSFSKSSDISTKDFYGDGN